MGFAGVPKDQDHAAVHGAPGSGKTTSYLQTVLGLLALLQLPRVGPRTALRIALTTNYDAVIEQHAERWTQALSAAEQEIDRCAQADIRVLSVFDEDYPARLRSIHDPPPVLYLHGSLDAVKNTRSAAVVGTRAPSSFGCSATEEVIAALAAMGWVVVSGLAKGIDTLAHGAALKHHTPTVAVMAGGLDDVYPKENRELARAIVDQDGALISETGIGRRPRASSFVARNRIQTALAAAVMVMQTGITGGTMHTVRHAAAQGKPVFCPRPHSRHEKNIGLSLLLDRPAKDLCAELPAWRDSWALCSRLGDLPLARPVERTRMSEFLGALDECVEDPQTTPTPRWWPPTAEQERTESLFVGDEHDALLMLE